MLHGWGSDAKAFAYETSMATAGVGRGYVMAYLEGTPTEGDYRLETHGRLPPFANPRRLSLDGF